MNLATVVIDLLATDASFDDIPFYISSFFIFCWVLHFACYFISKQTHLQAWMSSSVIIFASLVLLGVADFYSIFIRSDHQLWKMTAYERNFTWVPSAVLLTSYSCAHEFYSTCMDWYLGTLTLESIGHHAAMFGVAFYCSISGWCHYYGPFYYALPHLSSIFLSLRNKCFNFSESTGFFIDLGFFITFMITRVFVWLYVCIIFWNDMWILRDILTFGRYMNIVGNLTLTGLQLFWGYLITKKALCPRQKNRKPKAA